MTSFDDIKKNNSGGPKGMLRGGWRPRAPPPACSAPLGPPAPGRRPTPLMPLPSMVFLFVAQLLGKEGFITSFLQRMT